MTDTTNGEAPVLDDEPPPTGDAPGLGRAGAEWHYAEAVRLLEAAGDSPTEPQQRPALGDLTRSVQHPQRALGGVHGKDADTATAALAHAVLALVAIQYPVAEAETQR
jgi:hypothetical protein